MKKFLSILLLSLCCVACSKDNDPQPEMNETVKQIWQTLDGTFVGVHEDKLSAAGSYSETIVFHPYSKPREILPVYEDKCMAFGHAEITDTRFEAISGSSDCYYSIKVAYSGATPTISFFEYGTNGDIINREDKRNINVINASSCKMWNYGSTEAENAIIFTKQ